MAFSTLNFFGASIGKATAVNILLPDQGVDPFPVLYLLHGLSDDYTIWHRRTSLERYVADLPLIVCMVDGGRSFYCNDDRPSGMKYEDHMFKDIVGLMDRTFRTIPHRRGRAIAGLSMGGYATWVWGPNRLDVFAALMPVCGGGDPRDMKHLVTGEMVVEKYGTVEDRVPKLATVPIWAFHGKKDDVVPPFRTQQMVKLVKNAGGDVKYTEFPEDGHNSWDSAYGDPENIAWLLSQRHK